MDFFKGNDEDVRKAADKEELARRYCFYKAYDAKSAEDADLWEFIADYVIPSRSQIFYDMDAAKSVEDERKVYEEATLDQSFTQYKALMVHYNKTVKDLVASHIKVSNSDLDDYIKAHYVA